MKTDMQFDRSVTAPVQDMSMPVQRYAVYYLVFISIPVHHFISFSCTYAISVQKL